MVRPQRIASLNLWLLLFAAFGLSGCSMAVLSPDNWEFRRAEKQFEKGNFARAVVMYHALETNDTQEFRRDTILFRKGECYMGLNASAEAQLAYSEIVRNHPGSEYLMDAKNRLRDLQARGGATIEKQKESREDAQSRLESARETLKDMDPASPRTVPYLLEAADALWNLQRFDDSRDVYVQAMNLDPAQRQNPQILGRLALPDYATRASGGTLTWLRGGEVQFPPLDPADVIPLTPQGARWLIIYNTTLRWRRQSEDPRVRYAIITGQVKNQSDRLIPASTVEVTLLNLRREIYGVQFAPLPSLSPGATAAFQAVIGPIDDFENVTSYETRALISPGGSGRSSAGAFSPAASPASGRTGARP